MVYSNKRKLLLSGWLMKNGYEAYNSPLKLQKFLLLYEAFSKVNGEHADFSHLRGYQRGPVFSNVWGDYTHERQMFDEAASREFSHPKESLNLERAQRSKFIVSALSEKELSELTHKMNMWKSKESRIMGGESQVDLHEEDFNDNDKSIIEMLNIMYPIQMIQKTHIITMNNLYYVFSSDDATKLTETHFDTLSLLSDNKDLANPVFVEIDEEGRLVID